ncbi:MAG TPA: ScyD/ScyE family protein [Longimicrobiales bacterium]|nr:ScyD/ScyE family protein [Longimicrobiales bacterium]
MRLSPRRTSTLLALAALAAACSEGPVTPEPVPDLARGAAPGHLEGPYEFAPPVFDIAAAPDGGILVAEFTTIKQVRGDRVVGLNEVPTLPGLAVNGLAASGRGSIMATSGAGDLAMGAGLWHVTPGRVELVGDIEAFETASDPDAFFGPMWKNQACEENPDQGFSAGPQSNPYHVAMESGGSAIVADAAGNTVLAIGRNGAIELVAVLTPPVDGNDDYRVLFPLDDTTDCYVQPVATSVAIDADGAIYVGELTGAPSVPEWSRVWRVEPGARGVVCPSADCTEVLSGLTSVIDLEFGPDGHLYVVEFDENGWLAAILGNPGGGTINRCDVVAGTCEVVEGGLSVPGAIAFDKRGDMWVLESGTFAPTVRRVDAG